jgi:CHAT domain-containing protein
MKLLEVYLLPLNQRQFRAIATHSPAGDGSADSSLPFWEGEQDRRSTLIKVLEGTGVFRSEHFPRPGEQEWMVTAGILTPDQQSFHPSYLQQIGQALYAALFPSDSSLKSAFQTALRLADQKETELHLRLKFSADSAERSRLADYPWELLHDGQRFLQHRQVVVSRYIAYEALPPVFLSQERLRVLLISPRSEDAAQGLAKLSDAEQQAIRVGLSKAESEGSIVLESLPKATLKALSANLSQRPETQMPQVLHFDGHGLFGKRCVNPQCSQIHAGIKVDRCRNCSQKLPEPTGFLLFEDEQGRPDYVSAASLAAFLPKGVALVVLSACQSGMAIAGESVFNGTAQQLIDARVPAVVAMQYAVRIDAASQFAEQFYRVLGQKQTLLKAVNEGRKWMGVDGNQWYRPVLYLRWLDNQGGAIVCGSSDRKAESI